jgi:Ca2+-binding EF-hand superfamily protein
MTKILSLAACLALAGSAAAQTGTTGKPDDGKAGVFDAKKFIGKHDKNKDGTLARDELPEKMRKWFDRVDANKDGKLGDAELRQHAMRMWRSAPVEVVTVWVVEAVDPLTRQDVQQAYEAMRKIDADNDGKITEQEIKASYKDLVRKRIDTIVERYDSDDDGKLSKEEAEAGPLTRAFGQLDKNSDGHVDRSELERGAMPRKDTKERAGETSGGKSDNR